MADSPLPYATPARHGAFANRDLVRAMWRLGPLLIAIVALLVVFELVDEGRFLSANNMIDLMEQVSINTILALGITLTILIGGIDLSVGAVVALAGTVAAYLLTYGDPQQQSVLRFAVAVSAALLVALAIGGVNGTLAATTRMPPFIITLGTMQIARGAAKRFNEAQPISIPDSESAFLWLGTERLFDLVPVPVVIMLVVFAASAVLLHRTRFGQHVYAIGGSREAARFTGIPLGKVEVSVYLISGGLAGLAGMVHASRLYSAEPGSGVGFELDAIAAAVVGGVSFTGGVGTMFGTLLGAVVIGILSKGLNQAGIHHSYQEIIKGAVILAAVYLDVRGGRK
jgi:ribose transport system permease protein